MATVRVQRVSANAIRCPRLQGANNAYAGEVPAYSLVKPNAVTGDLLTITRPDADSLSNVVATGPAKIAQSTKGLCSGNWPLPVKYAGAAPAVGDERGTAANSFQLTTGKTGFKVVAVDSGNGVAWVVPTGGTGGVTGLSGTPTVIVSEAGTTGTLTTVLKSDTVAGLLLRKNGTAQAISGLMFGSTSSGIQIQIAVAANEDAERAATAHEYATVEVVPHPGAPGSPDGGLQAKFNAAAYGAAYSPLGSNADGMVVRVSVDAGNVITGRADGLYYDGTPKDHADEHEPGGGDAMAVDAAAATGSLRTLGTSGTSACAGDDSRLSNSRTPTAHNVLSVSHGDTLADSVASGDLMIGNATPKWARLAKGDDGDILVLVSGLPEWTEKVNAVYK